MMANVGFSGSLRRGHGVLLCLAGIALSWAMVCPAAGQVPASLRAMEQIHTRIYTDYAPAVVGLTCTATSPITRQRGGFYGTGAVISADGLILTNSTVIPPDAENIKVYLTDGRVLDAERVQVDVPTEAALIRARSSSRLKFMPLADSDAAKVGDPIYSWGNPFFTIQNDGVVSLSTGILSGRYTIASADDQSRYVGQVLETDAAINPGSDGGPITDAEGRLLGICSLAFSKTRWLGVAVPTNVMVNALDDLRGKVALAPRPADSSPAMRAWTVSRALRRASEGVAQSTIALFAVYEQDSYPVPETLSGFAVTEQPAIPEGPRRLASEKRRFRGGLFTGVIVDESGLALTSSFALQHNRPLLALYAYLPDGSRVDAEVLGRDAFLDLAVLQLHRDSSPGAAARPFRAARLEPVPLRIGQSVAVLGRGEFPGRVLLNTGIVSGTGRIGRTSTQISALINHGNMGGPVVDLDGRLVGIAAHLDEDSTWRQNCGVGFYLNSETILEALPLLMRGETPRRPRPAYLGVGPDQSGDDSTPGAKLATVQADTPAARAGIKPGDVIVEFGGEPVTEWFSLVSMISRRKPGDEVPLVLLRSGKRVELVVTLGERP